MYIISTFAILKWKRILPARLDETVTSYDPIHVIKTPALTRIKEQETGPILLFLTRKSKSESFVNRGKKQGFRFLDLFRFSR